MDHKTEKQTITKKFSLFKMWNLAWKPRLICEFRQIVSSACLSYILCASSKHLQGRELWTLNSQLEKVIGFISLVSKPPPYRPTSLSLKAAVLGIQGKRNEIYILISVWKISFNSIINAPWFLSVKEYEKNEPQI